MKNIILLICLSGATVCSGADLVKNGNFSKDSAYWVLAVPQAYGFIPTAKVEKKEFECGNLRSVKAGYLTLNQAVNIKKGERYKLTFEAKGSDAGQYLVVAQDPGKLAHFSKLLTASSSWTPVEIEFTGQFDTDYRWFRKWIKATKDAELKNGRTVNTTLHEIDAADESDPPSRSWITFGLGGLTGTFWIRNISIVEVAGKAVS